MTRPEFARPRNLLLSYFERAGVDVSGDCGVEIEDIVDGIVEEAVEESAERIEALEEKLDRLYELMDVRDYGGRI